MSDQHSGKLRCIVVTPETTVFDDVADFVAMTAFDGEVGVYPKRSPLVARLGPGELRLRTGETIRRMFVDGGFGQVHNDVITILTPRAKPIADLRVDELRSQLSSVNAEKAATPSAMAEKSNRISRLRAQIRLAGR